MSEPATPQQSGFGRWMGSMWLYTLLRFGLFFALWGIVYLLGLRGLFAPLLALVLSVPLSFVLLAKPRAAFARQIEARIDAHRTTRAELDKELDPGNEDR
jgi:predicted lipid-binding transport protein (Tim44 family)